MKKIFATVPLLLLSACILENFGADDSSNQPPANSIVNDVFNPSTTDADSVPIIAFEKDNLLWSPGKDDSYAKLVTSKYMPKDTVVRIAVSSSNTPQDIDPDSSQKAPPISDRITKFGISHFLIRSGQASLSIPIEIPPQLLDEMGSTTFNLGLVPSSEYRILEGRKFALISPRPAIDIFGGFFDTTEGGVIKFTIQSTHNVARDLPIAFRISEKGAKLVPTSQLGIQTAVIEEGSKGIEFYLQTLDDKIPNSKDSSVIVSLLSLNEAASYFGWQQGRFDYHPSTNASYNQIEARVIDNDTPTIYVEATSSEIEEGGTVEFMIGEVGKIMVTDTTLNLNIHQSGNFVVQPLPSSVTVAMETGYKYLRFDSVADNFHSDDGTLTVRLLSGDNYKLHPRLQSASVRIRNNDVKPLLSVKPFLNQVVQDKSVKFKVISTSIDAPPISLPENLKLNLAAAQENNEYLEYSRTFQLRGGAVEEVISLDFVETSFLPWGTETDVIVRILDDSANNHYDVFEPFREAAVSVIKSHKKSPIRISAKTIEVIEGNPALFAIDADSTPADLVVNLQVSKSGDFFSFGNQAEIVIPKTTKAGEINSVEFQINTLDDQKQEADGAVTVTIAPGIGYVADSSANSATVPVLDNDINRIPKIFVFKAKSHIYEGGSADFVIGTEEFPVESDLQVNMEIALVGDFLMGKLPDRFTLAAGMYVDYLELPTQDDNIVESDGSVSVAVLPGGGYAVDPNNHKASLEVLDNDNENTLLVFVANKNHYVTEGSSAGFVIGSDAKAAGSDTAISISITQSGDFLDGDLPEKFVLAMGKYIDNLYLPTVDDEESEPDGEVAVTILPDRHYAVDSNASSATIDIRDNDSGFRPTVEIRSLADHVIEGNSVDFEIGLYHDPIDADLEILLSVSQMGGFLTGDSADSFILASGRKSAILRLDTKNNQLSDPNGTVTVAIVPSQNYYIQYNFETATIEVRDDEGTPEIFVRRAMKYVYAGETADFEVGVVEYPVSTDLPISLQLLKLEKESSFAPASIVLPKGQKFVAFSVDTKSDSSNDGRITIRVQPDEGYIVSKTADEASIDVRHKPTVKVFTSTNTQAVAGETLAFRIEKSVISVFEVSVNVRVGQVGQFLAAEPPSKVKIPGNKLVEIVSLETVANGNKKTGGLVSLAILAGREYVVGAAPNNIKTISIVGNSDLLMSSATPEDGHTGQENDSARFGITADTVENNELTVDVHALQKSEPNLTPIVSISAVSPVVEEGSVAQFQISIQQPYHENLAVLLKIHRRRVAGVNPQQQQVVIVAGQTTVEFAEPLTNDNFANQDSILTVSIEDSADYSVNNARMSASVTISDKVDRARKQQLDLASQRVLPDLFEQIGKRPIVHTNLRISQAASHASSAQGNENGKGIKDVLLRIGQAFNTNLAPLSVLLDDAFLSMPAIANEDGFGSLSVWGAANFHDFERNDAEFRWNGALNTGNIGLDTHISDSILAGYSVSISESAVKYETTAQDVLNFQSDFIGLHPYLAWTVPGRFTRVQMLAGYGFGKLEIGQEGFDSDFARIDQIAAEASGFVDLKPFAGFSDFKLTELNLKGTVGLMKNRISDDFGYIEDREMNSGLIRITAEAGKEFALANGESIRAAATVGWFGKTSAATGVATDSSIAYANSNGYSFSGSAQAVFALTGSASEVNLQGNMAYDFNNDSLGLAVDLNATWTKQASESVDSKWNEELSWYEDSSFQSDSQNSSFDAKIGCGVEIWHGIGVLTPFTGIKLTQEHESEFNLGSKLNIGSAFDFALEGARASQSSRNEEFQLNLNSNIKW